MVKSTRALGVVAVVFLSAAAMAQEGPDGANVNVTRVTLATGGLAEVEGEMGDAGETMRFAVERSLVADVLRTLVVTGDTAVRSIDLEAAEPVGERSVTGRLINGDLSDPATVLDTLIGESVEIRGGATQIAGRLLAYSVVRIPGTEETGERPALRIAVATEDGRVAYATFETLNALAIEGAAARERMDGVVPALRQSVDDGRRELVVRLDGEAEAGFTFVVPTTVWRPSYRAIVGDHDDVQLQGWATLENTTGLDWNDIELRLAVGTPVAYRQDVYSPLRTTRPNAPFEVGRTARAPLIESEMALEADSDVNHRARAFSLGAAAAALAPPSPASAEPSPASLVTAGPALAGSAATVFSVAGEIDLAAGRTLTVPFLDGSQGAKRIAFLTMDGASQPMDSLELSFDADATVPGGLIAVYDGAGFVGDARFGGADGGEQTILPFALSSDIDVKVTENQRQILSRATLADGVLRIRREARRQIVFVLDAVEPMTLVVDVPGRFDETFEANAAIPVALSTVRPGLTRLRMDLPRGTSRINLDGTRPLFEQYSVSNVPTAIIEEVLAVGGAVDEETAARLRQLGDAAARIASIDRRVATLEADAADLREAVAADRENLEAINVATPEGARVRDRIVTRTDDIDALLSTIRQLRQERLEAERRLAAAVR